jgi:hypothetical protein
MTESTARAVLRIIALVMILVGVSMATSCVLGTMAAHNTLAGDGHGSGVLVSMVTESGLYGVLSTAAIAVWGILLFLLSPILAAKIVA